MDLYAADDVWECDVFNGVADDGLGELLTPAVDDVFTADIPLSKTDIKSIPNATLMSELNNPDL